MHGLYRILVMCEDEHNHTLFTNSLSARGFTVLEAKPGHNAIDAVASLTPDLLLYNVRLAADVVETLRLLRERSDIPVIAVCADSSDSSVIACLDGGANDYIPLPLNPDVLAARVRAVLRSRYGMHFPDGDKSHYRNGGMTIDYDKRTVFIDGKPVHLTPIEYLLVVLFSQNTGKALSHDFLIHRLWGEYAGDSQLLRVNIANIRRKIERNPAEPEYIVTEVGIGYRMSDIIS